MHFNLHNNAGIFESKKMEVFSDVFSAENLAGISYSLASAMIPVTSEPSRAPPVHVPDFQVLIPYNHMGWAHTYFAE